MYKPPNGVNFFTKVIFFLTLLVGSSAIAGSGYTTYQARIIKPNGQPLEAVNVMFQFSILDPAGSCVVYAESYTNVNMAGTGGLIAFSLGSGNKTFPISSVTFAQVFNNNTTNLSCSPQIPSDPVTDFYNPGPSDTRKIIMQFNDGTGWQTLPAMVINSVPYAMYATNASTAISATVAGNSLLFNGQSDENFVQVNSLQTNCA